jgi:2-hydroxy-3-oxopropionate reductase
MANTGSRPTVGFIGLGIMGLPMARNLAGAGFALTVFDLDDARIAAFAAEGAGVAASPREVAGRCDIVVTILPDTPDVEAVLFATDGVAAGLAPGRLVIDMSSVSPGATVDFAARVNALGCDYLDAPVSGGEPRAVSGELTIMVGGPRAAFERARPLFDAMGKTVTLIGTRNGDGQVAKVANQIIVGVTVVAVAEALLFASKAGADPARVREALMGGAANSIILENHGARMLERRFDPTFRAALQRKDLGLAVEACRDLGLYLPEATAAWQLYNACIANGDGAMDHISVLKVLEAMAGHAVEPRS